MDCEDVLSLFEAFSFRVFSLQYNNVFDFQLKTFPEHLLHTEKIEIKTFPGKKFEFYERCIKYFTKIQQF